MKQEIMSWIPTNDPTFLMPSKIAFQTATAIQAIKGQEMDSEMYYLLLSERLQEMIDKAENPKLASQTIYNQLETMNLVDNPPQNAETAAQELIFNNWKMRELLTNLGIIKSLPKTLSETNQIAEQILSQTDWEMWLNAITTTPLELSD